MEETPSFPSPEPAGSDSPSCANPLDPAFIPDSATLHWVALNIGTDCDHQMDRHRVLARGQDRLASKVAIETMARIMKICLNVAAMVEAGEWPPRQENVDPGASQGPQLVLPGDPGFNA